MKILQILKKNWLSLVCGIVAVLAIVGLFWPVGGYYKGLKAELDKRASVNRQIKDLSGKTRNLPVVDLDSDAPKPLEQFPTARAIEAGQAIQAQVTAQAQKVMETALLYNQRELLVPGSLPETPPTMGFQFRDRYAVEVAANNPNAMVERILRGGTPPTDQEIAAAAEQIRLRIIQEKLQYDSNNQPLNQAQVDEEIQSTLKSLAEQMRTDVARKHPIYLDPGAIKVNTDLLNMSSQGTAPDAARVFWTQMGLWVQQDACLAIAQTNEGSTSVMDSIIKRLVKIEMNEEFARPGGGSGGGGGGMMGGMMGGGSGGESAGLSGPPTMTPSVSVTGRASNSEYDVMHYTLRLVCTAKDVPIVLQSLCRDRFTSVLHVDVLSLDGTQSAMAGYIYGPEPVVELNLKLETVFLRKWLEPLMPATIKTALGIQSGSEEEASF